MLTTKEKVFIRDWSIQKEGPKWQYYLQYIMGWSTVIFLALFFLLKLIMPDRAMGGWISFFIVLFVAIAAASIITHLVYTANEKKLQKLEEKIAKAN